MKKFLISMVVLGLPWISSYQLAGAPAEVEALFGPGQPYSDSGYDSDWFGLIEMSAMPWIKHQDLGWIYLDESGWIHQGEMGWIWVSPDSKGYLYRVDTGSWQYCLAVVVDGWFYDYRMRDYWNTGLIPNPYTVMVYDRLWQADAKVRSVIPSIPSVTDYPVSTIKSGSTKGEWTTTDDNAWTSGFWPGILWQLFDFTGDPYWESQARAWTAGVENQKNNTSNHDVGFQMYCSYGQGYRLTGDVDYRDILVTAAQSLNTRYSSIVGGMRSWSWGRWDDGDNFTIIADNMMNLELEFWASGQPGGDPVWGENAHQHSLTTYNEHIREDGGSYHCIIFDQNTGELIERATHQGYSADSTWARGQAWLIHGFTTAYRETGDPVILEAAQRTADFFLDNMPGDNVVYWDFDAPSLIIKPPRDSSAAAIAASGMMELARLSEDPVKKEKFWDGALDIMGSLLDDAYFNDDTKALLAHGTANKPGGSYDTGLVWGDYYLLEAMLRYLRAMGHH